MIKTCTEPVMKKSIDTSRDWQHWLRIVQDPRTRLSAGLLGAPGHMRLPQDWEVRDRLTDEHLLYLVAGGCLRARFKEESVLVGKGDLLWIRPGTRFTCTRADNRPLSILRCRLRIEPPRKSLSSPWPWRCLPGGNLCLPWLEWLIQEAEHPDSWSPFRLRSVAAGFFTEWARLETRDPSAGYGLTQVQRGILTELLAARPDARVSPHELARAVGLSHDYFSRCFRHSYGCTPRRWLLEQRIRLAALRLVESGLRVGEVAREFGYEDLFLFSRQFKLITGVSPLTYRKGRI
jgi:AraC-like DNA-binding protein/mannose-6-phosphate isomerase-like protein (cupin superfamily)